MNLPQPKPVIGIVGAIGAGKSVASNRFAALGAVVLDADKIGHGILNLPDARQEIIAAFGPGVIGSEGNIDRKQVASLVFTDREKLKQLEKIVHARMRTVFENEIRAAQLNPAVPAIVLDAAVLLEAGWDGLCDRVLFVDAPASQRIERVRVGRGWDIAELERREAMQIPNDEKKRRANRIIMNDGTIADYETKVDELFREWALNPSR